MCCTVYLIHHLTDSFIAGVISGGGTRRTLRRKECMNEVHTEPLVALIYASVTRSTAKNTCLVAVMNTCMLQVYAALGCVVGGFISTIFISTLLQ